MSNQTTTVGDLARETSLDIDEVLLVLWDVGIEDVDGPQSRIPRAHLGTARRALGRESYASELKLSYWSERLDCSHEELIDILLKMGFRASPESRKLPAGALKVLRRRTGTVSSPDLGLSAVNKLQIAPPFEWRTIGRSSVEYIPDAQDIAAIHAILTEDFASSADPIFPTGIKDTNLLQSAATRPLTALGEQRKYPTLEMAAASLMHSIVQNHSFHNGNKRTGLVVTLAMLEKNGLIVTCDGKDLFKFVVRVSGHSLLKRGYAYDSVADREVLEMSSWLVSNTRPIVKGDWPVRWRNLRAILSKYGCTFDFPNVGNRINIYREVDEVARTTLGFKKTTRKQLHFQSWYGDEGRTVERNNINAIRKALRLDPQNGVDSQDFYSGTPRREDEFVRDYRDVLSRLAKV